MTKHNACDKTLPESFVQKLKRLMAERPLHEESAESHRKNRNRWALGDNDPVKNYPAGLTGPQKFTHQKAENRKFFAKEKNTATSILSVASGLSIPGAAFPLLRTAIKPGQKYKNLPRLMKRKK